MKRLLLFSGALILAAASMVSAQTTGLTSLQSKTSFGVFSNQLDGALSADQTSSGPSFNDLKNRYLFGGIANLNALTNSQAKTYGAGSPVWLGYFSPGSRPWSLFLGLSQWTATAGVSGNSTSTTTTPGTSVTVGSTTYNWTANTATTTQTVPLFSELSDQGQFLTTYQGINGGLYGKIDLIDNSAPASNQTVKTTYNYNSAATGAVPAPKTNYTTTVTNTALKTNNTYTFKVPAFLKMGDLGNAFLLSESLNSVDNSSSYSSTQSAPPANPASAAGSFTNLTGTSAASPDITNKTGSNTFGLNYTATLPFLKAMNPKNQAFGGVSASLTTYSINYGTNFSSQVENYTGSGSQSTTKGTLNSTTVSYTTTTPTDVSLSGQVGQRLYFDLGSVAQFGMMPNLTVSYSTNHNKASVGAYPYQVSSDSKVVGTSSTGDTTFATAGDTKVTTTNTYTNATLNPSTGAVVAAASQNAFSTTLALPVALKFQPKGWLFGITLGDEPKLSYTNTTTVTSASSFDTTTTNATAGGASTTTTTKGQQLAATGSTSANHTWAVTETHSIGGQIDISKDVQVSIQFTGTAGTGIWDFNNMTVQGIVALK